MSKAPTLASVNGATLSGAQQKTFNNAVLAALNSAGLQEGDRTTITADTTLTVTQAGLVLVDCTTGNVALTLPTSGATTDDASFVIRRLDSTANTLTITRGGADTIEGAASSQSVAGQGVLGLQLPAGDTDWKVFNRSGGTQAGARSALGLGAGADIASAATLDLTSRGNEIIRVTGTTAITALSMNNGQRCELVAVAALPLTYHATNMPLNGGASYTCAAGDRVYVFRDGNGTYGAEVSKASGQPTAPVQTAFIADAGVTAQKLSGAQAGSAPVYGARAWCIFDGTLTGTNAPTAGGNVTSVTRNGVGDYTINFSSPMQDNTYAYALNGVLDEGTVNNVAPVVGQARGYALSASSLRITAAYISAGSYVSFDCKRITAVIFC